MNIQIRPWKFSGSKFYAISYGLDPFILSGKWFTKDLALCRSEPQKRNIPDSSGTPLNWKVLRYLVIRNPNESSLKIAVLGCSTGAELYSVLWVIRSARPDLKVVAVGLDISDSAIKKSIEGDYSYGSTELQGLSEEIISSLFIKSENSLKVQKWLTEGVLWKIDDARNPKLYDILGSQDIVIANNFLCHMPDFEAANCLRNISKLVLPGGYLFVWGINLDIRTKTVKELGLIPVTYNLEEVHKADKRALEVWPRKYWGLEPLDKTLPDWEIRYATVFQVPTET